MRSLSKISKVKRRNLDAAESSDLQKALQLSAIKNS